MLPPDSLRSRGDLPRDGGPSSRQLDVSQRTRQEYDHLLIAMQQLEAALASPAPAREHRWAARAGKDLVAVRDSLEAHILSAEGPGGLFAELSLTCPPVSRRISELRHEHSRLLQMAEDLCLALQPRDLTPDFTALRLQATEFLNLLRQHYGAEVDLVFECFWTDLGVGD